MPASREGVANFSVKPASGTDPRPTGFGQLFDANVSELIAPICLAQ
jgi:hypothetical protein